MRTPVIVTLGKATQDLFVLAARDLVPRPAAAGRAITLPLGAKLDVDELVTTTGGNAANAATTFARQGLRSVYLWALGEDIASEAILEGLRDEGVDVSHVLVEPGRVASVSIVLLAPSGERTILNHRGSVPGEGAARIDLTPIASADWLYVSSLAGDMALLHAAVAAARAAGTRVLLNPAGTELQHLRALLPLLPQCDVVAVNADEARLLLGVLEQDLEQLAMAVAGLGCAALVTDGGRGAAWCDGRVLATVAAPPAHAVVDTTGCGDAFASGFLARSAQGRPIADCLTFAAANAAAVLGRIGARAGILRTREAIGDAAVVIRPVSGLRAAAPAIHGSIDPVGSRVPAATLVP